MALPPEFNYSSEDDFIQRLLIPLLQRLGFSLVVNYHGVAEFGRDLIFAEVDRFGHVRYHALQAKYVPSISLNEMQELIADAHQAFHNPFRHPQTGTTEYVSTFYAVNGVSLGDQAADHYFNSLRKNYGDNVRLLQGKDLLTLDRSTAAGRTQAVVAQLTGVLLELKYNLGMARHIRKGLSEKVGEKQVIPLERLRHESVSAYLGTPSLGEKIHLGTVLDYWHRATGANRMLDKLGQPFVAGPEQVTEMTHNLLGLLKLLEADTVSLWRQSERALVSLGPVVPI